MEAAAEAAAAAVMDFNALSRRELQALCKRNGVRANMTNAAMAEALQGLTLVDGIHEIGTTLCLPTPGRSAMKSAAKMAELAGEEPQHNSPLPRGRRVSVKSPETIRMEVMEEGEDEMKRDLVQEIVKTPGVALRSTSRRTRATPAPLPTPVPASSTRATARRTAVRKTEAVVPTPATLRRSQRAAARKTAGPVDAEDFSAAKATTKSARSKMTMALDQEAEVVAASSVEEIVQQDESTAAFSDVKCDDPDEEKVQQEEPKAVASDVKCDDSEEEVTRLLEGDSKEEELEEGEEADSSDATTGSAAILNKSCNDPKEEEKSTTKPQEGIVEDQEPISAEKSASLTAMEDSPILGVLSKAETAVPVIEKEQGASVEDCEDLAEFSGEMTDEIIPVIEDKEVASYEEVVKEDGIAITDETDPTPKEIPPAAAGEDETIEEDEFIVTVGKEGAADEMIQAGETSEEDEEDYLIELKEGAAEVLQVELADHEKSEDEGDLTEVKEEAAAKMLQGELTDYEASEDDETSEEDEGNLTEVKEGAAAKMLQGQLTDDETSEEDDLDENEEWASDDEENSGNFTEVKEGAAAKMLQGELTDDETSEEDVLDENEEWASDDEDNSCETGSTMSDEDTDETNEDNYTADAVQMSQGAARANDASTEDDDFSGDLPPEFDNITMFSDTESESDIAPPVLEENQAAVASATKTDKKFEDDSVMVPEEVDATTEKAMKEVDNIAKSLDEFTFMVEEAKETQDYNNMSLRQLKSTYKKCLVAKLEGEEEAKGKRLPLEEVDDNACIDH